MPKDIVRLVDMMTTFGVTLCQVEFQLKQNENKAGGISGRIGNLVDEDDALKEFEASIDLNQEAKSFVKGVERRSQVAIFRDNHLQIGQYRRIDIIHHACMHTHRSLYLY